MKLKNLPKLKNAKMTGEAKTAVESRDGLKQSEVDEPVKANNEVIVEEDKAAEKKDEEKEKKAVKPKFLFS